ncbi:immunoglobulin-like domain-containing protein [Motilimonas eburnea]|uniref:immunoglobulin-like domain-containing protein n=1 Tax=Motilimonas eburnea TaxID=1737488 RepID=UPI001E38B095|nr:immunoglobulin-like domain-containing protein [Motilimonas eburnea]MCE2571971.1 DUF5011 domain-containing protein [Motilimonas eburnea]
MNHFGRNALLGVVSLVLLGCGGGSGGSAEQPTGPTVISCDVDLPNYQPQPGQPEIRLLGDKVTVLNVGDQYVEPGVIAMDPEDGDISGQVLMLGSDKIDMSRVGDYFLRYQVKDSDGTPSLAEYRIVRVVDGEQVSRYSPRLFSEMDAIWEFYEQLPVDFGQDPNKQYPLLISNHGWMHSKTFDAGNNLQAMNETNVVKMFKSLQWDNTLPFIVLAPQRCQSELGDHVTARLNSFVEWAMRNYPVDASRVYMTGLSNGGFMTWDYAQKYGDKLAGAAPIVMGYWHDICPVKQVPIWAFTAENDTSIPASHVINAVETLRQCPDLGVEPKLTVFSRGGHLIDDEIYSLEFLGEGLPEYDVYDQSIFDWFLSHQRSEH